MLNRIYSNYCSFCHEAYKYEVVRQEVIMIIPRQSVIHSVIYFYIENYWIKFCLKTGKLCQKCCCSCILLFDLLWIIWIIWYLFKWLNFLNNVLSIKVWNFPSWHKGFCFQIWLVGTCLLYKIDPSCSRIYIVLFWNRNQTFYCSYNDIECSNDFK